jgi:predicted RNase H-like HicB family nuclease
VSATEFRTLSASRTALTTIFDRAEAGSATVMGRRGHSPVAVLPVDRADEALAANFPLDPKVSFGAGGVAAWIAELPVHAQGATIEEAGQALVEALREYADDWESSLRHAPNHAENWGYVFRVRLRPDDGDLFAVLFGDGA